MGVKGGHEVDEAVTYAMNRTVSVLEGSKSGASLDEASSGLDSVVAEAMTTREDGRKRIESEMNDLRNGLMHSRESNEFQNQKLNDVHEMLNKIKKDLKVVPLTEEEKAYEGELENHVKKYMSRAGEFGSEEEKIGDDLSNLNEDARDAAKERTSQGESIEKIDQNLEKIETQIEKLRPDLREISLRRSGEGLTSSEDEFPDLSENDLVERGRPFAFLEEDEDTNDDGDEDTNDDGDEFKLD